MSREAIAAIDLKDVDVAKICLYGTLRYKDDSRFLVRLRNVTILPPRHKGQYQICLHVQDFIKMAQIEALYNNRHSALKKYPNAAGGLLYCAIGKNCHWMDEKLKLLDFRPTKCIECVIDLSYSHSYKVFLRWVVCAEEDGMKPPSYENVEFFDPDEICPAYVEDSKK